MKKFILLLTTLFFSGIAWSEDNFADYNGKRFGVQTGTICGRLVEDRFPDSPVNYYESNPDAIAALQAGKIDAFSTDDSTLRFMQTENPEIEIIKGYLAESNIAAVFPKTAAGQALRDQYSAFVESLWADGTMDKIAAVWFGSDDAKRTVLDYENLPAPNGTLRMVADLIQPPFTYMKKNRAVGYDLDVVSRFCQKYGYGLEIVSMSFGGILPAVQSGKCDFAASNITVTKERAETVLFSTPVYYGGIAIAVAKNSKKQGDASEKQAEFTDFADLSGKTVSMLTGAPFEELVKSKSPNVGEFTFFNNTPDMIQALKTKKTDAFLMNNAVSQLVLNRNPDLVRFPQSLQDGAFGIAFAKGNASRNEWQSAYDKIPPAEIQKAWEKWTGADDSIKILPKQDWQGANGIVRVAACDTLEPMSYVGGNGELKGFDLEVILMIARKLDVKVEFTGMEFSAILAAVQSGKTDMGAGSIIITKERAQSVDFLEYYPAAFELVVRATRTSVADATEVDSIWHSICSSFHKTFLRENRWKLFITGVCETMVITLMSILFGTLLGFGGFLLCRNGSPLANRITRFCMWLVQGMPMVVLLMVLYYIVFGSFAISGVIVAIIGFTLTFGSAVFGLLKIGVNAVDNGQNEAACALGYSSRMTFFKIILPQALPHVMSAYKGEIVSLLKATAVVGYIAVQDLTKMGDIVRSRTYEAFFPLIAVTIIYFVLEGLIGLLVSKISININPKRRKREDILKGIKTDD